MAKMLDNLQTLSRVLLLIAATLIVTATYHLPHYPYTLLQQSVTRIGRAYDGLLGDIQADATQVYRAELGPAFKSAPQEQAKILDTMQFTPTLLTTVSGTGQTAISLTNFDPTVDAMLALWRSNAPNGPTVSYPVWTLDAGEFVKLVDQWMNMPSWSGLITAKDLVVEVGDMDQQSKTCLLRFRSESWEQKRSALSASLPCSAAEPRDVTTLWRNAYLSLQYEISQFNIPLDLLAMPRSIAAGKLTVLAATDNAEEEKEDILGVKIGIIGVLNIGPIIIIAILAMMLGQVRWASRMPDKDPAEGTFWFSQFQGLTSIGFVIALWALPFVAAGMATSATYVEPPELFGKPWYDPALLNSQKWFTIALVVSFGLSTWLAVENWIAARAWRKRLNDAASIPADASSFEGDVAVVVVAQEPVAVEASPATEETSPAKAPASRAKRSRSTS